MLSIGHDALTKYLARPALLKLVPNSATLLEDRSREWLELEFYLTIVNQNFLSKFN